MLITKSLSATPCVTRTSTVSISSKAKVRVAVRTSRSGLASAEHCTKLLLTVKLCNHRASVVTPGIISSTPRKTNGIFTIPPKPSISTSATSTEATGTSGSLLHDEKSAPTATTVAINRVLINFLISFYKRVKITTSNLQMSRCSCRYSSCHY